MRIYDEKAIIAEIESGKTTVLDLSKYQIKDEKGESKAASFRGNKGTPHKFEFKNAPAVLNGGGFEFVFYLLVLPDGRLASTSYDNSIKIWDAASGTCQATLKGHSKAPNFLALSPGGQLLSVSPDKTVKFWDIKSGNCQNSIVFDNTPEGRMQSFVFLPDGRLARGSFSGPIQILDFQKGKWVCQLTLVGHRQIAAALLVLDNGQLVSGSQDHTIKLWDTTKPGFLSSKERRCLATLTGHNSPVNQLLVLNGKLVSRGEDIKFWDTNQKSCLATLNGEDAHKGSISALAGLADGRLASSSSDRTIKIWDPSTMSCLTTIRLVPPGDIGEAYSLAALQDGRLASGLGGVMQGSSIVSWDVGVATMRPLSWTFIKGLFSFLQKNHSIRELNLQKTLITDEAIPSFIELLQQNSILTQLNLRDTAITSRGIESLAQELKQRQTPLKIIDSNGAVTEIKFTATQTPSNKTEYKKNDGAPLVAVSLKINYGTIKIEKEIGRGGYGVVYKGIMKTIPVAVKQLLMSTLTEETLKEFKSECTIMAQMRAPNVVQFLGYCESPHYCLVMEFMPRGALFNLLHNGQPIDPAVRDRIIGDVTNGLAFLHANGVLHRDLKSLNVLLDENYKAKLSDFGLSRVKSETRNSTSKGGTAGTLAWMAPELAEGANYTDKCDIYSYAVLLWEIMAREIPFKTAANPLLIPLWVMQGKREIIPKDCPAKIATLITICWDKDPARRFTAAQAAAYWHSDQKELSSAVTTSASNTESFQGNLNSAPVSENSFRGGLASGMKR